VTRRAGRRVKPALVLDPILREHDEAGFRALSSASGRVILGARDHRLDRHAITDRALELGARTTTAALGMINDNAKSQIPGLG